LKCGANIITTNNYACIPGYLQQEGIENQMESLTKLSVSLAQEAKRQFISEKPSIPPSTIQIAGSIPPLLESYRPDLKLSEQISLHYYSRIVRALKGVDILLIETMSALDEALYALRAIAANGSKQEQPEIFVSFTLSDSGNLRSDEDINEVIETLEPWMKHCHVRIISLNCCTPESIERAMIRINEKSMQILEEYDVYLGAYPNGTCEIKTDWTLKEGGFNPIRTDLEPQELYAKFYKQWINKFYHKKRLRVLGGCCNIEPHHIKYMADSMKKDFPHLFVGQQSAIKSKL